MASNTATQSRYHPGVQEVLAVINILRARNIRCCIVRVQALRFYGARARVPWHWDICVSDSNVSTAVKIFDEDLSQVNTPAPLPFPHPIYGQDDEITARFKLNPKFKLNGLDFYFSIVSESQSLINLASTRICRSVNGVPYASPEALAAVAITWFNFSDFADLVDGMDLDRLWVESNLPSWKTLTKALDKKEGRKRGIFGVGSTTDKPRKAEKVRELYLDIIDKKDHRLQHYQVNQSRYVTRFRAKGSPCPTLDPRA